MMSEDEYDYSEMESVDDEEIFADSDDDAAAYGQDDRADDNAMEFAVLKNDDIRCRVGESISEISNLPSVSREAAIILLCKYGWNVSRIYEEWFADEEKLLKACGLMMEYPIGQYNGKGEFFCGICLENYWNCADNHAFTAACGHVFCERCWKTYVSIAIKDGPGCLFLRCPQPSCGASIGEDIINLLASDEDKAKYENYVFRSYVEDRKNIKWCPAPECQFAVECLSMNSFNYDVVCGCSSGFCWNCSEEAHSPADCETVAKWILKNGAESENMNWILTNTKPCPKCKKSIEKNQGCMHMICMPPCKFEFCWLCLGAWSEHGETTGGFYSCNRYLNAKESGEYNEADNISAMAKVSLEKYMHYYERWDGNDKSMKKALLDMKELQTKDLEGLSHYLSTSMNQLQFISNAWVQIVECRRVLKWTYASGYYLSDGEPDKKEFFEYSQGEAERWLEVLHHCAEKELFRHIRREVPLEEFPSFSAKLKDLTRLTRNFFDNLVRAFEKGLSDSN